MTFKRAANHKEEPESSLTVHDYSESVRGELAQLLTVLEVIYDDTDGDPSPEDMGDFVEAFLGFMMDITPIKAMAAIELLLHLTIREKLGYNGAE